MCAQHSTHSHMNGLHSAKVRTGPPVENMKVHHDRIHSACLLDIFTRDVQDLENDALMGSVWTGIVPVCTISGMPEPTTYGPKDPPLAHSGGCAWLWLLQL